MTCSRRLYKGNSYDICLPLSDTGVTSVKFYTGGDVIIEKEAEISGDTMCFSFTEEEIASLEDGVLRYDIGDSDSNTSYVIKTPGDYSGSTLEDIISEAFDSGYTKGQEECSGGSCEGVWQEGFDSGYTSGHTDGFTDGYASGYTDGQEECSGGSEDLIANLQGDYYVIPEGTTKLRDYAFYETRYQSNITIPDSVEYIGNHAFMRTYMSSITIPDSVSGMGDEVFSNSGFKEVSIGSGITKLPNGTFYYDSQLYSVSLPSGITEIGEKCFFRCQSLSSITLPEAVTKIGEAAFKNCSSLTEVILPYGLTGIQRDCFTNCVSLTGMNFPSTIQTIGDTCFSNCMSLTEMTFEGAVPPTLSSTSGSNASLGSTDYTFPFWVPCDSYDAYVQAFGPAYAPRVMCAEG